MLAKELENIFAKFISNQADINEVDAAIEQFIAADIEHVKDVFALLKDYLDNSLLSTEHFAHFAQTARNCAQATQHQNALKGNEEDNDSDDDNDEDKTVIAKPIDEDKTVITTVTETSYPRRDDISEVSQTSLTSSTSQTSTNVTSTSVNTSTTSSWAKPFNPDEEVPLGVGSVIKERFRLTKFIGRGGMGDVYKAEDLRRSDAGDVETEVAIKVLNSEFRDHPDSLRALQREARKTQSLAHPHIVNVYDFDRDNIHVFMTMEYMSGRPLNEILKKKKLGFEPTQAREYIGQLCDALHYAHKRGLVHSDLKPNNIFLTDNNEIKIFDFGIARAAAESTTSSDKKVDDFDAGSIGALTPSYASPEMLDNPGNSKLANVTDDIYALGCIVYELYTGAHPFVRKGKKVPSNVARDDGLVPDKIKALNARQQAAVLKCLAFEQGARTQNIEDFRREFLRTQSFLSYRNIGITLAGAALVAILASYAVDQHSKKDINELLGFIESNNFEQLQTVATDLLAQDQSTRLKVFENSELKSELRDYFRSFASQQAKQDNYTKALNALVLAAKIYPDSIEINTLFKEIESQQKNRVLEVYKQLDAILQSTDSVIAQHENIATTLKALAKIDEENKRLSNKQPLFKLQDAINTSVDVGNLSVASRLLDSALEVVTTAPAFEEFKPQLLASGENIKALQSAQENKDKINELLRNVQVAQINSLNDVKRFADDIVQLNQLAPADQRARDIIEHVNGMLDNAIQQLLEGKNWNAATAMARDYKALMSTTQFNKLLLQIENERAKDVARLASVVQEIEDFASNLQPDKASELLAQVDNAEFSNDKLLSLNDTIADSWLAVAQQRKQLNQWTEAKQAINEGLDLTISGAARQRLNAEAGSIKDAELAFSRKSAEEERNAAIEMKRRMVQNYVNDINEKLNKTSLSIAELSSLKNSLESLKTEEPNHPLLATTPAQAVNKIVQQANTQLRLAVSSKTPSQNQRKALNSVLSYTEDASKLFPPNDEIYALVVKIKDEIAQQDNVELIRRLAKQEDEIYAQVAAANDLSDFDEIDLLISEYKAEQEDRRKVNDVNQTAQTKLVDIAQNLRKQLRFDEAKRAISRATQFGLSVDSANKYVADIADAEIAEREVLKEKQRLSNIESLAQSAIASLEAGNFDVADSVERELRQLSGVSASVYRAIDKAYADAAYEESRKYYGRLQIEQAINWVNVAISKGNAKDEVMNAKSRYRAVASILNARTNDANIALKLKQSALEKYPNDSVIKSIEIIPKSTQQPLAKGNVTSSSPPARKVQSVLCREDMAGNGKLANCRDAISDSAYGPYLVVLPRFNGRLLAISKYEIRVGEYNEFCIQTESCSKLPGDELLPAVGVQIAQINAFTAWLSKVTGSVYRLPDVNEWRFAARANGRQQSLSNCSTGTKTTILQPINFENALTSNGWGVSNYLGNVQEIVRSPRGYSALGGHYQHGILECNMTYSGDIGDKIDNLTGFRLIKEL